MERARAWYDSAEYRAIRPLRTRNSVATVILAEGVPGTHRGRNLLKHRSGNSWGMGPDGDVNAKASELESDADL